MLLLLHNRKIPCLDEDSDPLLIWKGYDQPDSIAVVSATEANCDLLFKAGGQVLTTCDKSAVAVHGFIFRQQLLKISSSISLY